jgi:hypothetical protein
LVLVDCRGAAAPLYARGQLAALKLGRRYIRGAGCQSAERGWQ